MTKPIDIKVNNKTIKGVLENPQGKILAIIVHGFTGVMDGYKDINKKLSIVLQEKNYAVLRFNFLGTPPSEGEYRDMTVESQTVELNAVIKHVKSLGYSDIILIGESMGGTIVASSYDDSIKAVVFWYTAFDFADSDFSMLFTDSAKEELSKNRHVICDGFEVGEKFIEEIKFINVYDKLKNIKCPVLLLHGDKDTEVPYQQSEKAFEMLSGEKKIKIIEGADHCFAGEQEEVIELTVGFLRKIWKK